MKNIKNSFIKDSNFLIYRTICKAFFQSKKIYCLPDTFSIRTLMGQYNTKRGNDRVVDGEF